MKLKINPPIGVTDKGIRPQNEDSIYPMLNHADEETTVFVVCDGVGGSEKGEVASKLAANFWGESLSMMGQLPYDADFYEHLFAKLKEEFVNTEEAQPDCAGMGTTLVFANLQADGVHVGWVGDSRIIQVRNGKIIFKSRDHSFVMKLVEEGEITEDEAVFHPQKNIILRSVSASDLNSTIELELITDVQPGDKFLLCSDGITDQMEWSFLEKLFVETNSLNDVYGYLERFAKEFSRDNYSLYLFEIGDIGTEKVQAPILDSMSPTSNKKYLVGLLVFLGLAALISFLVISRMKTNRMEAEYKTNYEEGLQYVNNGDLNNALHKFYKALDIKPEDSLIANKIMEIKAELDAKELKSNELKAINNTLDSLQTDLIEEDSLTTTQDTAHINRTIKNTTKQDESNE